MALSKSALRSKISEIYEVLEEQGPTLEIELRWLDLKINVGEDNYSIRAWYHLGYSILDRKQNFGAALRCLKKSLWDSDSPPSEFIDYSQRIFLYAAFVADDKDEAISALNNVSDVLLRSSERKKKQIKLLVIEYLQLHRSSPISNTMESAIRRLFSLECNTLSVTHMSGGELVKILDPHNEIVRRLKKAPYLR